MNTRGGKREGAGRTALKEEARRVPICVTIDPSTRDRLRRMAERRGVGLGRVLDDLITAHHEEI